MDPLFLERRKDLSAPDRARTPLSASQPRLHAGARSQARGLAAKQLRNADPGFGSASGQARVRIVRSDREPRLRVRRLVLHDPNAAGEDLGVQERAHQSLVGTVAKRLGLVAQGVGVLDRVVAQLSG